MLHLDFFLVLLKILRQDLALILIGPTLLQRQLIRPFGQIKDATGSNKGHHGAK